MCFREQGVLSLRSLNMKSEAMSKGWIWMSYMDTVTPFWWSLEMRVRVCCARHTKERPAGVTRAERRCVLAVCFPAGETGRERERESRMKTRCKDGGMMM